MTQRKFATNLTVFFLDVVGKLNITKVNPTNFDSSNFKNCFTSHRCVQTMFMEPIFPEDLNNVIKSLKSGTSPGIVNISSALIKIISPKMSNVLLYLINLESALTSSNFLSTVSSRSSLLTTVRIFCQ